MAYIIRPAGDADLSNARLHPGSSLPQDILGLSAGTYELGAVNWAPSTFTIAATSSATAPTLSYAAISAQTGAVVTANPTVATGTAPITYALVSGPSWLAVNSSSGQITGTAPGTAYSGTVAVSATNSAGTVNANIAVTVTVAALAPTLAYAAINVPEGTVVTANPTTATGTAPITYAKVSGPSWLSVNSSSGQLTGTAPAGASAGTLVVSATNSAGSVNANVSVTVTASAGTAPAISAASWPQAYAMAGTAIAASVTATGSPAPTSSITALSVNGASGLSYVSGLNLTLPTSLRDGTLVENVTVTAANGTLPDATANPGGLKLYNNAQPDLANTTIRAMTPVPAEFPTSRQVVFYGDSIVAGTNQQFAQMTLVLSGHKVWFHPTKYNYAQGGQPIAHVTNTQIPAMQAHYPSNVPEIAVIKIGTNGGANTSDGSYASLVSNMTTCINALQSAGHKVIFLCNEIPSRGNAWSSSAQGFYDYHLWLQNTAPGLATTATIIPVDTWSATGDPRYLTDVANYALHPDCIGTAKPGGTDVVHPGSWGHERMAAAVANAIEAQFATSITDFNAFDINRMDGSLAVASGGAEGSMPNGWNDAFIDTAGVTYTLAGTGHNTTFTVTNTNSTALVSKNLRAAIGGGAITITNGYLTIGYEIPEYPDAVSYFDQVDRDFAMRINLSNASHTVDFDNRKLLSDGDLNGAQKLRRGGKRFLTMYVGNVSAGVLNLYISLPPGGWIKFTEFTLRSGS